jgi:aspartyl-tRNA(Asn)/glutamyl-tRNA(Gln) amidotransferase subunit C
VAVTIEDVRHIAELARLGLDPARARSLLAELNTILGHMEVLAKVDTAGVEATAGVGAAGTRLRPDARGPVPLARAPAAFAPPMRDGFFIVPRLSTHEIPEVDA